MSRATSNVNFDEIAKVINSNFDKHKIKIQECCVKTSIIPLTEYYEALNKEYKEIESRNPPSSVKPDPLDYQNLFKLFDEYPSNLQKPKKQPLKELRMNYTIKGSKQNSSSSSINSSKLFLDQPSATTIYNGFLKYIQKLSAFEEELRKQTTSKEYHEKLESINTFAKELNKLVLSMDDGVDAFTKEEEMKIKKISENMEHFVYIQENQDLYSVADEDEGNSARIGDLVDIVTDALLAVNCYKSCLK